MQAPYGTIPPAQPQAAAPKRYDGKNGNPLYDTGNGGHYGASAAIAAQGHMPPSETFTGHWANVRERVRVVEEQPADSNLGLARTQWAVSRHPQHLLAEPSHEARDR